MEVIKGSLGGCPIVLEGPLKRPLSSDSKIFIVQLLKLRVSFIPAEKERSDLTTANLPTHVTLTANAVMTVIVAGNYSSLDLTNHTAGSVAWARGDGADPAALADESWPVFPVPYPDTDIPVRTNGDGTTTIKLISTGTPTVTISSRDLDCDD